VLTPARRGPFGQREQRATGGVGARVQEGLGHRGPHRGAVLIARQHQRAGGGHHREVGGVPAGLGPALPERRDGDGHEAGVGGAQGVEVHGDGAALDQDVGPEGQGVEVDGIDGDRPLAPVVGPLHQRAFGARPTVAREPGEGPDPAGPAAGSRLHRDHVGAERRQHHAAQMAAVVGEVEDAVWPEHSAASVRSGRGRPPGV